MFRLSYYYIMHIYQRFFFRTVADINIIELFDQRIIQTDDISHLNCYLFCRDMLRFINLLIIK